MFSNRLRIVLAFATVASLGGCLATHRDVSSEDPYNARIGQVCEVLTPLRAHGYTHKLERNKKTDGISIWNPGFSGPEVTFLVYLQPGTALTLLSARECTNCPFDRYPQYLVKVSPEPKQFGHTPAYLRDISLLDGTLQCAAPK
jgi:hypothetical protein